MENFKRLLNLFKDYNGKKVEKDFAISRNIKRKSKAQTVLSNSDYIAKGSAALLLDPRLKEDDLIEELSRSLDALAKLYSNPIMDYDELFCLLLGVYVDMESLFGELDSPSSTLKIQTQIV